MSVLASEMRVSKLVSSPSAMAHDGHEHRDAETASHPFAHRQRSLHGGEDASAD